MVRSHGTAPLGRPAHGMPPRLGVMLCLAILCACLLSLLHPALAAELKLVDAPLSLVIEMYSKETGRNVFLDETVQKNRTVTAYLPGMGIEEAFDVVKTILGLQSCRFGDNGLLLFPPERARMYNLGMKPEILNLPAGIDPRWFASLLPSVAPNVTVSPHPKNEKTLMLFGPEDQLAQARSLLQKCRAMGIVERSLKMTEPEAKLARAELDPEGVEVEVSPPGLIWRGKIEAVDRFDQRLMRWRRAVCWGQDFFTPKFIDCQRFLKAIEATKGRAVVTELGGTGSIYIEGPMEDHLRLCAILKALDAEARPRRKEIPLGELSPELAQSALKGSGLKVEGYGKNKMVLVGQEGALENAAAILTALRRKNHQVLIRFRLAEVQKNRLRNLGIELDKTAYSYGEIKEFHPKDTLPLLLQVLDEGKHARTLAQPNVRVIEGEEAKVTIGDRIPLEVAATAQTDAGSTLKLNTQLTWVDVGIKMTVRQVMINPDRSIRMVLKTEVSSVVGTTKQGYPQIRTREAESSLRVDNGGSIVMGGLLSQEDRRQNNQVPIISQVPLVGWLLRSNRRDSIATEIVMIVTARLTEE